MIFEEALKLMREGKKITHKYLSDTNEKDVYLKGCYVGFPGETYEQKKSRGLSVVKMKGDKEHEDMGLGNLDDMFIPGTLIIKQWPEKCKHGFYPQLNLLLIMSDEWEVYDDKTNTT